MGADTIWSDEYDDVVVADNVVSFLEFRQRAMRRFFENKKALNEAIWDDRAAQRDSRLVRWLDRIQAEGRGDDALAAVIDIATRQRR